MELTISFLILLLMFGLIAFGVPIAFALGTAGAIGLFYVSGFDPTLMQISMVAWMKSTSFELACIPLFILMGQIVFKARIAGNLFDAANKWFGFLPGGLGIAAIFGCAIFAAVTGSSVAAAATMGSIAIPAMKNYKYHDTLSTSIVAAGGTLGILIPPSVTLVFYAVLTETSIGALFMAGIGPGILTGIGYVLVIFFRCKFNPLLGPPGPKTSWKSKISSIKSVIPPIILLSFVLGGIYSGMFSPTEAAGLGVVGAMLIGIYMRTLSFQGYLEALLESGKITAMIFAIIIGGILFSRFLAITGMTEFVVGSILDSIGNRWVVIFSLIPIFIILGMFLDVYGMMVLSIPVVYPVLINLGFDPIWFGVFITIMCEVALITPPVGANVFVIHSTTKNVPLMKIFKGVIPMILINLLVVLAIIIFPQIVLWIPSTMMN